MRAAAPRSERTARIGFGRRAAIAGVSAACAVAVAVMFSGLQPGATTTLAAGPNPAGPAWPAAPAPVAPATPSPPSTAGPTTTSPPRPAVPAPVAAAASAPATPAPAPAHTSVSPVPVAASVSVPVSAAPVPAPAAVPPVSAPPAPSSGPGYAFEHTNADGSPSRWDACETIHYVTNLAEGPATAGADVAGAIARLSQATGITFVDDGSTTEVPSQGRAAVQAARYGAGWAPLLIAWARPSQSDYLPSGVVGEGGNVWTTGAGGNEVYVTGQVAINADTTGSLTPGFGAGTTMGQLLLHELGHAVGLGHVADPNQVMYPEMVPRASADYGAGDLRGLNLLGRGSPCQAEPTAP